MTAVKFQDNWEPWTHKALKIGDGMHHIKYSSLYANDQSFKGEKLSPPIAVGQSGGWGYLFIAAAKDCGITWTTNHKNAAVRGGQSANHCIKLDYIRWQLSVATLSAASDDPAACTLSYSLTILCLQFSDKFQLNMFAFATCYLPNKTQNISQWYEQYCKDVT